MNDLKINSQENNKENESDSTSLQNSLKNSIRSLFKPKATNVKKLEHNVKKRRSQCLTSNECLDILNLQEIYNLF